MSNRVESRAVANIDRTRAEWKLFGRRRAAGMTDRHAQAWAAIDIAEDMRPRQSSRDDKAGLDCITDTLRDYADFVRSQMNSQ